MGSGEVGGGGSVRWNFKAKNLKNPGSRRRQQGWYVLPGADEGGTIGKESFTIKIRLPKGQTLAEFKKKLRKSGNKVKFDLPIENSGRQIQIHWPDKP